LPSVLKKFKGEFPNVDVSIVFEATHHPIEKLVEGALDLAITSNPELSSQIEYIDLFTDEMFAVVSPNHPWAEKPYVEAKDFEDVELIIHSLPLETVSIFRNLLAPKGIMPKKLITLPLTEASIELVKANMGVIVMANWALNPYLNDEIKSVKVTQTGFHRQQYAARMQDREYPVYFDYFIKFLRQELQFYAEQH
jgi:LysR family transcriptional regulator for metE and metH